MASPPKSSGKKRASRRPAPRQSRSPRKKTPATEAPARIAAGTARRPRGRQRQSHADAEARRREILAAALSVFSEHGFEAARLDEIARRANVAKGTLYLYFANKQDMFEALVRSAAQPVLGNLQALSQQPDLATHLLLNKLFAIFRREVLGTDRKLIMRLVISEGPRFPEIAAFYHREVISRVMAVLGKVAKQAWKSGELATDGPMRYPQLIAAPLLMSVIWDALFDRIDPLDVEDMLGAHAALLTTRRAEQ